MFASADPSDPRGFGACVPKFPSRPSQKMHACVRFTTYIGTSGFGAIMIAPCLAYDQPSIFATNATYVGTASTQPLYTSAIASQWQLIPATLPYGSASFGSTTITTPGVQGRIISAGLKVSYTGKVVDMAGTYACFVSPDHNNLNTSAYNTVLSNTDCVVRRISSSICSLVVTAVAEEETEYSRTSNPAALLNAIYPYMGGGQDLTIGNNPDTIYGPAVGVIHISGTPGTSFYCEYFVNCEYIGAAASQASTVNEVDVVGFNAVAGATQNMSTLKASDPSMTNLEAIQIGVTGALQNVSQGYSALPAEAKGMLHKGAGRLFKHYMEGGLSKGQKGALRIQGG